jgi:hypothetical protein
MNLNGVMKWLILAVTLAVPATAPADSFLDTVAGFLNLKHSAAPMKGPRDEITEGSIWLCNLERGAAARFTPDGGYRSPLFASSGADLFALKGDVLIRIRPGSLPEEVRKVPRIVKLVAFHRTDPYQLLVLLESDDAPLGILSLKSGAVDILSYNPKSDDHKLALAWMQKQACKVGTTRAFVKKNSRQGRIQKIVWTDVFVKKGDGKPVNVSNCDGTDCSQPALSTDGRQVAFVRSDD